MERLTRRELWWGSQGKTDKVINYKADEERRYVAHEGSPDFLIADKLAEYEDLEERLNAVYGECDGILEILVEHLERHENVDIPKPVFKARLLTDGEVDRWEEFKGLEEQGRLFRLSCKVGDTVYYVDDEYYFAVLPVKVDEISIMESSAILYKCLLFDGNGDVETQFDFDKDDFGKTVFLTQQEAEQALEEMEGKK